MVLFTRIQKQIVPDHTGILLRQAPREGAAVFREFHRRAHLVMAVKRSQFDNSLQTARRR